MLRLIVSQSCCVLQEALLKGEESLLGCRIKSRFRHLNVLPGYLSG